MLSQVKNFLKSHDLLHSNKTFLVGFSGGYDSMCLLDLLCKIAKKEEIKLIALHLNHNWRATESQIEQENCERFCKEKGIDIIVETLSQDIPKTETVAREKRQEFFRKYYKKYNADGLFLAHTKSDNTETIVYRLAKGTGVKGLCGILENSQLDFCKIYRPLMNFSREEILKYCKSQNLSPNNDSSNSNTKYARNFIRHKVVPELRTINSKIDDTILNLSKIAISEQNIIEEYLTKIKKEIKKNDCWDTQKFAELSKDVQNRLILDVLTEYYLDYDTKKVEDIYAFINKNLKSKSGKTLSLTTDLWLFVSKEKICIVEHIKSNKTKEEIVVNQCGEYNFRDIIFEIEEYNKKEKPKYPKENEFFAYVNLENKFPLNIRAREDGDVIQPFGMEGSMKLKKLLINKGIEKFKRDDIILLCRKKEVLWVAGVCLSEKLRVQSLPTHVIKISKSR